MGKNFAVIDTETTWGDDVMSIGIVIADCDTFESVSRKYYILTPYKNQGGMYSNVLYLQNPDLECLRDAAMLDLKIFLTQYGVEDIFAYNALFDHNHLLELKGYKWFDIIKVAAYRQYNTKIPDCAECFKTGKLKRGYGVEDIYRMLSGKSYYEKHNALTDAVDELEIMRMLGLRYSEYSAARITPSGFPLR
ncbi:MAG: hypothetical protein ACI4JS_05575 [Oscillospiraceae bacterium]